MADSVDLSRFKFSGRDEFFRPPLNQNVVFPLVVEAYRLGFARGCKAGADDVLAYLGLSSTEASCELTRAYLAMAHAVPHRRSDRHDTTCALRPVKGTAWQRR